MKVALDMNGIYTGQAGVARYLYGLRQGFKELADPDLHVSEVAWPVRNQSYRQPQRALRTLYRELLWPHTGAQRTLGAVAPEIVHVTGNLDLHAPRPCPRVITVYDVAPLRTPERFRPWHRRSWQRLYSRLHTFDRIICISRFTADELLATTNVPASRIEVVHCGTSLAPSTAPCATQADTPPEPYFLFVGSLEPGKNLNLLQQTYELAQSQGIDLPRLRIAGARREGVAHENPPPRNWDYLGYINEAALVQLYEHAIALVFPSTYEGFGLPLVEAMNLGCPVICSEVASLPEVGGDACLYSELTPEAYLNAICQLRDHAALRQQLIAAGHHRAALFTWANSAEQLRTIYSTLLASPSTGATT